MSTYRHIVGSEDPVTVNELPADRALVESLVSRGVIDRQVRRDLLGLLYPRKSTENLVLRSLLGLSAAFFLFGFSAILAANWGELGIMLRMGLPQLVFAASLAGAIYLGLDKFSGQLLASVAAFSIGGVLIVLSQEFQLNADAPWLFGRWLLLAMPIVLVACYLPLWLAWITLLHVYVAFLLGEQIGESDLFFEMNTWGMLLISGGFVGLRQLLLARTAGVTRWSWLQPAWPRALLLAWIQNLCVIHLSFRYAELIFDGGTAATAIMQLIDVAVLVGIHYWLRMETRFDIWSLLVSTLAIGVQLTIIAIISLAKVFEASDWDEWQILFLLGAMIAFGIFFGCTLYLRKIRHSQHAPAPSDDQEPGPGSDANHGAEDAP
ncbi:MAG: DUF2157 domain-containing protein [Planctomycetaceae bacterium]|nr:DUF2157 domain-containing protein [Planctomycetaceae bacterium]